MQTRIHYFKLVAAACLLPFIFGPQFAQAQTVDRAVLIELIELLQQQIVLLQAQLEARQASSLISDDRLLEDFPGTVIANYVVQSELLLPPAAPTQHQRYADKLRLVLPTQYRDYINQFVVFADHPEEIAAYVAVSSDGRNTTWMYGVSAEEINHAATSESSIELMVHEFAHIFSLDQQLASQTPGSNCPGLYTDLACFSPGSYLGEFVTDFWDERLLAELVDAKDSRSPDRELLQFYERYESEFVSDYAATDPSEDFAESFAWYVLDEPVRQGTVAADKVDFMDQFQIIRSYKKHIQSQL